MDRDALALLIFLGILFVAFILTRKEGGLPDNDADEEEDEPNGGSLRFPIAETVTTGGVRVRVESELSEDGDLETWFRIGDGAFCISDEYYERFSEFLTCIGAALRLNVVKPLDVRTAVGPI